VGLAHEFADQVVGVAFDRDLEGIVLPVGGDNDVDRLRVLDPGDLDDVADILTSVRDQPTALGDVVAVDIGGRPFGLGDESLAAQFVVQLFRDVRCDRREQSDDGRQPALVDLGVGFGVIGVLSQRPRQILRFAQRLC